jgi:hypothetical protein
MLSAPKIKYSKCESKLYRQTKIINFFLKNPNQEYSIDDINLQLFGLIFDRQLIKSDLDGMMHFLERRKGYRSYLNRLRKICLYKVKKNDETT